MAGLAILFLLALYLLLFIGVVWLVARWAGKHGRSKWRWGLLAAFVMYNLVFWDFIPTYVVYKYYAHTKAGFWVYKTPEQWKAENPGVAETLTWKDRSDRYEAPGIAYGFRLNERIVDIRIYNKSPMLHVTIGTDLLIDTQRNKILAKQTSVSSEVSLIGSWNLARTSLDMQPFNELSMAYKKLGRKVE